MLSKQEEIREGIGNIEFNDLNDRIFLSDDAIEKILSYLHSQGVVIKVGNPRPDNVEYPIATESLIKGGK